MTTHIQGIGTVVPEGQVSQDEAAAVGCSIGSTSGSNARTISALYRRAGVNQRHSVALNIATTQAPFANTASGTANLMAQTFYPPIQHSEDQGPTTAQRMEQFEQHASDLAIMASQKALSTSSISNTEITHLITISCTGFFSPGIDILLIQQCELPPSCQRTQIGFMGCHGAINGLRVMKAITDADSTAKVLMCALELCSLHQQYGTNPQHLVSNSLFSDGSAALVGTGEGGVQSAQPVVAATASTIIPNTQAHMSWRIRDHGFEMSLSPEVPGVIERTLRPWIDHWLSDYGYGVSEIQGWGIHPGGPKILNACKKTLALPPSQLDTSRQVLSSFGNMSSPTVLFILEKFKEEKRDLPWVLLAFGPGLSVEAALITTAP